MWSALHQPHNTAHALFAWDRMRVIRARCSERHPGGKSGRGGVRFIAIPHDRTHEHGHANTHQTQDFLMHWKRVLQSRTNANVPAPRRVRKYPLRAQPIIFS